MGFVLVRFFVGNNSAPITVVTDSPTPSEVPSVIPSATPVASATPTIGSPTPSVDASAEISDVDKDGLTAAEERYYGTDPNNADTDGDGYKDGDEVKAGYDPLGPGKLDSDNDGFPDPDERAFGTDPFNPDTDGDGYKDGDEIAHGHSPLIAAPNDKL
jgi:hypothetical protein